MTALPHGDDEPPAFVTVADVADMLAVSKMTVYRMVRDKDLESIRVRGSIRVSRASVQKCMGDT